MAVDWERERSSKDSERAPGRGAIGLVVLTLAGVLLLGFRAQLTNRDEQGSGPESQGFIVDRVIDGDTIVLRAEGDTFTVRLLGVDTPESVSTVTPIQCFGAEATAALAGLLPPGTAVHVGRDTELRDHYGRLLLHITRQSDGLHINHWLVAEGYANAVTYPPNTLLRSDLALAERQARADGRGLWAHCDGPDQPLDPP